MTPHEITALLAKINEGDADVQSRLASVVYDELHRMAAAFMRRERNEQTIQATVLVHDAFLRLMNNKQGNWQNRAHFFAMAATHMRNILTDYARSRHAATRGGRAQKLPLEEATIACEEDWDTIYDVDQALKRLAEFDPRQSRILELKFFAGMTVEEISEVVGLSDRQVSRELAVARRWLQGELAAGNRT